MAEKKQPEKKEEKAEGGEVVPGKSKKKLFIIIGAIAAVVVLAGAVAAFLLLGKDKKEGADGEPEGKEAEQHEAAPAIYESLGDKFVVTLQYEGRQHYLQVTLNALIREAAVGEELKVHAPLIRGKLISLLGSQDFAALRTEVGKLALRDQILTTIREILQAETGKPGVEQVFFTEFVLQ
jgi:flagellar protein FliL